MADQALSPASHAEGSEGDLFHLVPGNTGALAQLVEDSDGIFSNQVDELETFPA